MAAGRLTAAGFKAIEDRAVLQAIQLQKEEGTTTTPFDMVVRNDLDRFHLVSDVVDRVPKLGYRAAYLKQHLRDRLIEHRAYITEHGQDLPEICDWKWPYS
jgi:xylulose-5-phosphate/fructose-6-phosphate phosphoketolase